jgi:hypothetical protein
MGKRRGEIAKADGQRLVENNTLRRVASDDHDFFRSKYLIYLPRKKWGLVAVVSPWRVVDSFHAGCGCDGVGRSRSRDALHRRM